MLRNKYFWAIVLIVVISLLIGFFYFRSNQEIEPEDDLSYWQEGSLPEWSIDLTEEQKAQIEEKLAEAESIIANSADHDSEELFFAYLKIGIYMESLNKPVESRDAYLQASRYNQESAIPWLNLHNFYLQANDLIRAEEALNRALELESSSELVWDKVLDFYQYGFNANLITMLNVFNQAFEHVGENIALLKRYARYLESENALGPALEQWEKIVEIEPSNQSAINEVSRLKSITGF